ncbi:MAG: MFS transporter [Planctomycetes bacterium]|nr:MFS transporter [Planctomycetota bacterium]
MTALADGVEVLTTPTARVVVWTVLALLAVVIGRELRNVPKPLLALMAAAFLDMVGLFLVLPLVPFYVQTFAGEGLTLPWFGTLGIGALSGLMASAYTIAQMLSAPLWGRLSDRIGRRPVLMIAIAASGLAFGILAVADSLWLLLLSRLVQGTGGGTVGVIQAYVADTVEPAQRTRGLGWLSAATNLGVALGPALGSGLVELGANDLWPGTGELRLGNAAPGLGAAVLCLGNLVFVRLWLRESHAPAAVPRTAPPLSTRAAAWGAITDVRAPASRLLWIYGIAIGAAQGIGPVLPFFLQGRLGFDERTIGYVFLYIGAISVLARVLLLGPAVDRLGEARLAQIGITTLGLGFLLLSWIGSLGQLALAIAAMPLGTSLTFPCISALLSRSVHADHRGLYLGLQQTFGSAARLGAPLLYGWAYDALGDAAPLQFAAALVLSTWLLAFGLPTRRGPGDRAIVPPTAQGRP